MDAVIYIRDMQRMCKSHISCNGCELKPGNGKSCMEGMDPQKCISVVEQWAAEHTVKTRQSVFFEQWPDARIHKEDGLPMASPCDLDGKLAGKCEGIPCPECRKKFWLAEVEE